MDAGIKQDLKRLAGLSVLAKIAIVFITVGVLKGWMDMYSIHFYYEHAMWIFQGNLPYLNYYYEYPILIFIPVGIALIPSLLFNNFLIFALTFSLLMIVCDCITTLCIYLIALKIWGDRKRAILSAIIYLTAISTMYFVMTIYDAFPSCLLMIGLTLLLYGKRFGVNEYTAIILGYFTKIYPIVALPFVVLYNSRSTSLRKEVESAILAFIPLAIVLVIPLLIWNPASVFKTYVPSRMDIGYFPDTVIWTVHVWLHDIFRMGIRIDQVLVVIYICMAIGLISLLYAAFRYKGQDPVVLLKFILLAIMLVVLSFKVRSPGYIVWYTPFLCLLISDSIYKIGLFYFMQVLAFIEFPMTFWTLWTNVEYTNPIYSANWYLALILFTVEFSTIVLLVWFATEPVKLYRTIFFKDDGNVSV